MSLDVTLYAEAEEFECVCTCGHTHKATQQLALFEANITHNLTTMAALAGIHVAMWRPEELEITKAKQLVPLLRTGLEKLKADPEKFKMLNPDNGWGSYEGLVRFVSNYLQACEEHPDSEVSVSR